MTNTPLLAIGLSFYNDANCLENCLNSVFSQLLPFIEHVKVLAIDGKYKGFPSKEPLSTDGSREVVQAFAGSYPSHVELYDFPNLHERFKRQKYVDIAGNQQIPFLLILDTDEYLESKRPGKFIRELEMIHKEYYDRQRVLEDVRRGNLPYNNNNIANAAELMLRQVSNVHNIKCVDRDSLGYVVYAGVRPRLWYRPQDMTYTTKHFYWKRRDLDIPPIQREEGDTPDDITRKQVINAMIANSKSYTSFTIEHLQMWHDKGCRSEDRQKRQGEVYA